MCNNYAAYHSMLHSEGTPRYEKKWIAMDAVHLTETQHYFDFGDEGTIVCHSLPNCTNILKPVIHFTDKLDILEREKEKDIRIYGNRPNGLWWLEFRLD
ncbi:hypothetical protein AVEN_41228-1 [Araneus ventricosus]|uniref:Uncharacterized protein n=1 Tax=Araneus ventricosus TaxID=182803 RepID=A0A4Y2RW49_ARAVE|nr:hypothetical protein AVEN_41228-1 [Araneus ventricosus]